MTTISIIAVKGSTNTPIVSSMWPIFAQSVFMTNGSAITMEPLTTAQRTPIAKRKLNALSEMAITADVFLLCRVKSPMIKKATAGSNGISQA